MNVGIISYGAGNLASVVNALERLGVKAFISSNAKELEKAERLIFPGVGHASVAMKHLAKFELDKFLSSVSQPVLGICLGMQLMGKFSEEGNTKGIGLMDFSVQKFNITPKVPHMGWNNVFIKGKHKLFEGIDSGTYFYFVHSYYAPINLNTTATCNYEVDFSAAVENRNYYGVQFHPEKSGDAGLRLLKNFLQL